MSIDGDDLTEEQYLNLLDIRERFDNRRRAMHNGEILYPPDDFSILMFAIFAETRPMFKEFKDGQTYPIVSKFERCPAGTEEHPAHSQSNEREFFCANCRQALGG